MDLPAHGTAFRTADDRWRLSALCHLLWFRTGRGELQPDGASEGCPGKRDALCGGGARTQGHPGRMRSRPGRLPRVRQAAWKGSTNCLNAAAASAPARHRVDIADVGALATLLLSDAAHRITGTIIPVDGGQHLLA